jgi:hypothetical protein
VACRSYPQFLYRASSRSSWASHPRKSGSSSTLRSISRALNGNTSRFCPCELTSTRT